MSLWHIDNNNDGRVQFSEIVCGDEDGSRSFPCEDFRVQRELTKDFGFSNYSDVEGLPAETFKKYLSAMNGMHSLIVDIFSFREPDKPQALARTFYKSVEILKNEAATFEKPLKLKKGVVDSMLRDEMSSHYESDLKCYYEEKVRSTPEEVNKTRFRLEFLGQILGKTPNKINADISDHRLLKQAGDVLLDRYLQECEHYASVGNEQYFNDSKRQINKIAKNAGLTFPESKIKQLETLFANAKTALQDDAHIQNYLKPYSEMLDRIKAEPSAYSFEIQPDNFDYERYYIFVRKGKEGPVLFAMKAEYNDVGDVFIGDDGVRIDLPKDAKGIKKDFSKKLQDSGILAEAWKQRSQPADTPFQIDPSSGTPDY